MTVVVAYKWAPSASDASVDAKGGLDWGRAPSGLSDADAQAVELGRLLGEALSCPVVGVTVGAPASAPAARKAAAARGLDSLVVVDADPHLDTTSTALQLAAVVGGLEDVSIVLAGEASSDAVASMVPAVLAGALGWPMLAQVTSVESADGLVITQRVASGTRVVRATGPVVASVAPDATQPPTPGMRDILAAAKKPWELVPPVDTDVTSTPTLGTARMPRHPREGRILPGDPADAASELIEALRASGMEV